MDHNEYVDIFGLTQADLHGQILEYGCVSSTTQASWPRFEKPVIRCEPMHNGTLPFTDFTFDLALCPYYLFSVEDSLPVEEYLRLIYELARVAKEVRIYPLINNGLTSPHLGPVLLGLQQENYGVEVRDVTSSLLQANAMLRVWAQQCHVS